MALELQTGHDIEFLGGSMSCEAVLAAVLMLMGLVTLSAWEPETLCFGMEDGVLCGEVHRFGKQVAKPPNPRSQGLADKR